MSLLLPVIGLFLSCVCVRSSREWGEWGDWHSVRVGGHDMPPHGGLLGGALRVMEWGDAVKCRPNHR